VHSVRKPWWQQATALVTVSTGGVITGFTFVPGAAAMMTSPSNVPLHLLALEKAAKPADTGDGRLRPAIVNVAGYYLQLAQTRTPAQMEALIWGKNSLDGADHGPSCAAFASLTLELAAQAVGQQSWVSGGTTYPWPLHEWADVRVNPNPDSLGITSMVQDAQAHQRWHQLGDGYQPQPGDWVVFDGHVEVVTSYSNGLLDTIGADSLPNLTVNAHSFPDPLAQQGVEGFVDNGHLAETTAASGTAPAATPAPASGAGTSRGTKASAQPQTAAIPGVVAPGIGAGTGQTGTAASGTSGSNGAATGTGGPRPPAQTTAGSGTAQAKANIPGAAVAAGLAAAAPDTSNTGTAAPSQRSAPYRQHTAPATATPGTKSQQAFINQIAPGALAAQQRYGVPASVTIAQAIDESGWGTSQLAASDYNLFGIKGGGPAGSVTLPTQEFENGQWVTIDAQFRVYHNVSESIADHAELLATSGYYTRAMADRAVPDAFANDLTGVYATDPEYGSNLIGLMRLYNLYRFDSPTASHAPNGAESHNPASHSPAGQPSGSAASGTQPSIPGILSALSPGLGATSTPSADNTPTAQPSGAHAAASQPPGSQASIPGILSVLSPAHSATPTPSSSHTPTAQASASQAPTPQPTGTQAPSGQPSGSEPSEAQASIPGILSALAPAPAGTPTPSATQVPTAQPSVSQPAVSQPYATHTPTAQPVIAQPSAAQQSAPPPSGSQPSVGQASVPGIMSALSPTFAPTPTPSATHTAAATASPAVTPGASGAVGTPGGGAIQGNGAAAPTGSAPQGSAATHASSAAPYGNVAGSVQGAAAVPGIDSAASTSSATHWNSTAAHGNYSAAVPGTGMSRQASSPPLVSTETYESTAAHRNSAPPNQSSPAAAPGGAAVPGVGATVSGLGVAGVGAAVRRGRSQRGTAAAPAQPARRRVAGSQTRGAARAPGLVAPSAIRYETPLPATVATAFFAKAKGPLARAEQLHRDVAGRAGISWQLLAACDWMQCHADHTLSPVNGERLGKHNPDGTVYQTKSQALAQCASDLIYLAGAVYGLDLTARRALPVRTLADVFAAFRWGGLLMRHGVSAMEFPYSVAGLTEQHLKMHWPVIGEPDAPDKPGSKFRGQFGAVPVLLSLNYPALV
jgi:flagellum-specific peptidoglycan hydrolase FlgJ